MLTFLSILVYVGYIIITGRSRVKTRLCAS